MRCQCNPLNISMTGKQLCEQHHVQIKSKDESTALLFASILPHMTAFTLVVYCSDSFCSQLDIYSDAFVSHTQMMREKEMNGEASSVMAVRCL